MTLESFGIDAVRVSDIVWAHYLMLGRTMHSIPEFAISVNLPEFPFIVDSILVKRTLLSFNSGKGSFLVLSKDIPSILGNADKYGFQIDLLI